MCKCGGMARAAGAGDDVWGGCGRAFIAGVGRGLDTGEILVLLFVY